MLKGCLCKKKLNVGESFLGACTTSSSYWKDIIQTKLYVYINLGLII